MNEPVITYTVEEMLKSMDNKQDKRSEEISGIKYTL